MRKKRGRQVPDIKGLKFGRLTALEPAPSLMKEKGKGDYAARRHVVCECGKRKIVEEKLLKNGNTRSCGCLRRDMLASRRDRDIERLHGQGAVDG